MKMSPHQKVSNGTDLQSTRSGPVTRPVDEKVNLLCVCVCVSSETDLRKVSLIGPQIEVK